jgi:hypothetical protein
MGRYDGAKLCYVCLKRIPERRHIYRVKDSSKSKSTHLVMQTIGATYIPGWLWRHTNKCRPGSATWMKSWVGKRSELRKYYLKKEADDYRYQE